MSNYITANVKFYYKGEKLTASVELDIDHYMQTAGRLPNLYPLLAQAINLDLYSYEYEMMQAETIFFSNARGLSTEHVNEGLLNLEALELAWSKIFIIEKLQAIAQQNLSVDNLQQHPKLKNALLEAYQLGKETKQAE